MYAGNYDFWYESSQLMQQLIRNQNKKKRKRSAICKLYPALFRKQIQIQAGHKPQEDTGFHYAGGDARLQPQIPYVGFEPEREAGKDILFVEGITKTLDGVKVLDNVSFIANKRTRKIALVGGPDRAVQDPDRRDGAGRGQLQVGRFHEPELFSPRQFAFSRL